MAILLLLTVLAHHLINGAWIAAIQGNTRFSKISEYGSNVRTDRSVFMTIHNTRPPVNGKINTQFSANFSMASAARCPSIYFSFSAFFSSEDFIEYLTVFQEQNTFTERRTKRVMCYHQNSCLHFLIDVSHCFQ